jgi:hypothetical protein
MVAALSARSTSMAPESKFWLILMVMAFPC